MINDYINWNNGLQASQGTPNYINGDEALFADASLPRDNMGFKVKNGINTDKLNLKTSSTGIEISSVEYKFASVRGGSVIPYGNNNLYRWCKFQETYRASDLNFTTMPSSVNVKVNTDFLNSLDVVKSGEGFATVNNGGIEILKAGNYIIQGIGEFIFSNQNNDNMVFGIAFYEDGGYKIKRKVTAKQSYYRDNVEVNMVCNLKAGEMINIGYMADGTAFGMIAGLNIYKIG